MLEAPVFARILDAPLAAALGFGACRGGLGNAGAAIVPEPAVTLRVADRAALAGWRIHLWHSSAPHVEVADMTS
jgi:hypothetical protein